MAEWMWYTVATVYAFTLEGVGAVGAIGVAAVFPAALLSPALGYIIDRYPRERVLAAMVALRFVALTVAAMSAAFFPRRWPFSSQLPSRRASPHSSSGRRRRHSFRR